MNNPYFKIITNSNVALINNNIICGNKGYHFFNREFGNEFIEAMHISTNLPFADKKSSIWYINSTSETEPYRQLESGMLNNNRQGHFCIYSDDSNEGCYSPIVFIPWGNNRSLNWLFSRSECRSITISYEELTKPANEQFWKYTADLKQLFSFCFNAENINFYLPVDTNDSNLYRIDYLAGRDVNTTKSIGLLQIMYTNQSKINNLLKKFNGWTKSSLQNAVTDPGY